MSNISVNNGHTTTAVSALTDEQTASVLAHIERLDGEFAELRESVHGDLAPCSPREFVAEFCARFESATGAAFVIG